MADIKDLEAEVMDRIQAVREAAQQMERENEALRAALYTIGHGMTDAFPGCPAGSTTPTTLGGA